jgi:hypothetical protein
MRQQVLEHYMYVVFKLLIFFPLLRTTCSLLLIIPHDSLPDSTLPQYAFASRTSGHSQVHCKIVNFLFPPVIIIINIVSFDTFPMPLHLSVCLSVFRELHALTFSYSRCWTCPYSWPHHRQFTAPDSSSISNMSAALYCMFASKLDVCLRVFLKLPTGKMSQGVEEGYRTCIF